MKKILHRSKYLVVFLILVFSPMNIFAQWQKIADYNVGSTGQMVVHDSTVYLYGFNKSNFLYRSTDNGTTWTNIADNIPYKKTPTPDYIYFVHSHGNELFVIAGINTIYSSTDDGLTWGLKSKIAYSYGAVLSLVSDGTILYAVTNRNSIFKSTDNGSNWTQIDINYTQAQVSGLSFAAVGNTMVFSAISLGSFLSTDGGSNWVLKNPSIIIGTVHAYNGGIYGSTYGMYKLAADTGWQSITSGFPSGIGITGSTKSTISAGNKLFTYYTDIVAVSSQVFSSNDNGSSWKETGTGLTTAPTTSLNNFMAASSSYLYCYIYSLFTPSATGVYRIPVQTTTTGLDEVKNIMPESFSLSQNYPNPFNPSTKIQFSIPKSSFVTLKVYDALGREVAQLVNENLNAGAYNFDFDASKLTSGVYFYRIQADNFTETKKMILTK